MAELVGEGDEITFGIDDALLHPGGGLLEQAPQQVRLAGAGIALHQQTGGQQLLEVEVGRAVAGGFPHVDGDLHYTLSAGVSARRDNTHVTRTGVG